MMPTVIHGIKTEIFSENSTYECDMLPMNSSVMQTSNSNENNLVPCSTSILYKDELDHTVPAHFIPDFKTALNIIPRQPLHIVPGNRNIVAPVPSTAVPPNEILHSHEVASNQPFNSQIFLQHDLSAFRPRNSINHHHNNSNTLNDHPSSTEPNYNESTVNKPSEALFVRTILPRCKRLAPLWFKSVTSMRERNRGEQRKPSILSNQTQDDWTDISDNISQMDPAEEADSVVNLLKKLYKELPSENVLWLIKCWLSSPDACKVPHKCVISRGDAKSRMRRIDCGKGSDKVWRLDTIVGMLFHGLPMSSTDTSMMIHTCKNDLCVRPQHLRFRANSVSLVVVLKALAQAGYVVTKPDSNCPNLLGLSAGSEEFVDVFGPFSIEKLQQYRSENLCATGNALNRLVLNSSDNEFVNSIEVVRNVLAESNQPLNVSASHQHRSNRKSFQLSHRPQQHQQEDFSDHSSRKSLKRNASSCYSPSNEGNHDSSPSIASFAMHEHSSPKQIMINYDSTDGSSAAGSKQPRQPAKKRMEARTPNALEDVKSTSSSPLETLMPQKSRLIEVVSDHSQPPRNEFEDEEELIMIHGSSGAGNCTAENFQTPRKSMSAEPKSRNEMIAAAYAQIESLARRQQLANSNPTRCSSVSGLPKVGGSPSNESVSKMLDLVNLDTQSEFLRLLRNTPQSGRGTQEYQQLLDVIQSMRHQYGTKRSPVGDITSEFYRQLLNSPLSSSPLFLQQNGRGFTPLPVELDGMSFGQQPVSGRTTSSNMFRTPSLSPFTQTTSSVFLHTELPKLEQFSPNPCQSPDDQQAS